MFAVKIVVLLCAITFATADDRKWLWKPAAPPKGRFKDWIYPSHGSCLEPLGLFNGHFPSLNISSSDNVDFLSVTT